MQYKLKHRLSAALMAGAMCCTMIPAASADEIATPETADTAVPEVTDSAAPDISQITENLYNDLPDAPTGSYLGSMGLPVATGETKISISAWVSDLYDGADAHIDADALNEDETTITIGKNLDANYAIIPLLVQTEYPANGATAEVVLPEGVEVLSYASTDADLIPAGDAEQSKILYQTYVEQSAAATGFYVKAFSDFTAQFVYASPDGTTLQKSIHVQLSDEATPTQLYTDNGVATLAAGPTPPYATGKITSIAKEGGTWLIWFNGQEAYCCSHGLNGQPNGCPTYAFDHVSRLEPGQYTPGNHYANQINIWGGLGQLSLDMLDSKPAVMSADNEQTALISEIYDETQQWIIANYPDSYAAQTYVAAAEELANGTAVQSGENGYYTYIYNPPAGYAWQIVALVGEEIAGGTEIPDVPTAPEPQYYSASWTAPAQSASGSFDLTFTVNADKYQLNTLEKVDGAVITITPSQTSGSVDGGSWKMTPAGAQTITTSGHTQDDSFHLNGGDGSATWAVHYEVSKTSTSTLSGQEGPFTSQAEADVAAEAAKNAAINQLKNEAQGMVDLLSEEVRFTVQETGEIQKVTMYDAPAHSLIFTKRDIATNAKLVDARLTIRDAYGTTIDRWTTTDGDHAIRVLPERSAAKDPRKNLLLLSDDTSEHVYTMVEELAPDGYLVAESITFKVMQMNDALVVFVWQDGGWQKSSEGYLAMYDERTNTPMPLMKTFPQTGSIS